MPRHRPVHPVFNIMLSLLVVAMFSACAWAQESEPAVESPPPVRQPDLGPDGSPPPREGLQDREPRGPLHPNEGPPQDRRGPGMGDPPGLDDGLEPGMGPDDQRPPGGGGPGGPGRPGAGGPGGPRMMERRLLTDEEFAQRLSILKQIDPELAERLEQARQQNADRAAVALQRHWPRLEHLAELKRSDPDMFELMVKNLRLERQSDELARQHREARDAGRQDKVDQLSNELREVVTAHFDVRQQLRERELKKLEERLDAMRQKLNVRRDARDRLIEEHINELLGKPTDRAEF